MLFDGRSARPLDRSMSVTESTLFRLFREDRECVFGARLALRLASIARVYFTHSMEAKTDRRSSRAHTNQAAETAIFRPAELAAGPPPPQRKLPPPQIPPCTESEKRSPSISCVLPRVRCAHVKNVIEFDRRSQRR